ncbi:acyltransferase domain-containing protein, partial [Rhizobiaceae sp. 2RAB30]
IVEVAVARWWMSKGVRPAALIGHSMGENAAACVAGVLSFRDAVSLVRLRGELFDTVEAGGMLSVPLSAGAVTEILPAELDLASVNAPELCVVSGRDGDLERFRLDLQARGVDASRIASDIAAHSRMLEPILGRFEAFLRSIRLNAPAIPIVSNLTGSWLTDAEARDPLYWVRHLRSTVQFGKGVALLAGEPGRIFIEAGPSRALSSLVKLQPEIGANQVINSLPHAEDETDDAVHLTAALGRAWAAGLDVPLAGLWEGRTARRVPLPTYPFQHQRYFIERNVAASAEPSEDAPRKLPDIADWGYRPTWRLSVPDVAIDADKTPSSFLVFLDRAGFGAPLVESLRADGHRVSTVEVGDAFARRSAEAYSLCPEDGRAGYDALLSGIAADGPLPSRILHLWLVTSGEDHRPGSSFFNQNQEQGFYSLLHFAQALGDAEAGEGTQLTVVTNGMQRVGDEPLPYPEKATILGPGLVIPKEMPGVDVRLVDLSPGQDGRNAKPSEAMKAQHALLRDDLFAAPGSETVAYRNGRRWLRSYGKLPLAPAADTAAGFRKEGVYIVTGGLGDLALVMARELCERFDARLMLVGRTPLPPRQDWPLYIRSHSRRDR